MWASLSFAVAVLAGQVVEATLKGADDRMLLRNIRRSQPSRQHGEVEASSCRIGMRRALEFWLGN